MICTHVLLLLILNHSQTVASPADSAPSYKFCDLPDRSEDYNDFERALVQAPCPLLPTSAPSTAAFKVCVECTSTYVYGCECCSEVVSAFGVGTYPIDRSERHGCDTFA